jgi:hypothetical protein
MSGITDPENKDYILHQKGVSHLTPLLSSANEEIVLNTLATLAYIITPQSKSGNYSRYNINFSLIYNF